MTDDEARYFSEYFSAHEMGRPLKKCSFNFPDECLVPLLNNNVSVRKYYASWRHANV